MPQKTAHTKHNMEYCLLEELAYGEALSSPTKRRGQAARDPTKQAAQLLKDGHENYVRKDSVAQERRIFKVEQRVRKIGRRDLQKQRAEGSRQAGDWIRGRNGGRGKGRR